MRVLLTLIGITLASQVAGAESLRVDGVPIQDGLHDLSVSDLHEAIVAFTSTCSERPATLEVISGSEIHARLQNKDLGWIPMRRLWAHGPPPYSGNPILQWTAIGRVIWDIPEALRVLGTAEEVYIFPVATPREPHLDDKHLRLLDPEVRGKLERLLSDGRNWFHGFDNRISLGALPAHVGFLFRQGKNELALFFPRPRGAFNGEHTGGSLEIGVSKEMEEWKQQFAQPELAVH
jgi:hypothetical protein